MNLLAPDPTILIVFYFPTFIVLISCILRAICFKQHLCVSWLAFFFITCLSIASVTFSLVAYTGCTHISHPVYINNAFSLTAIRKCLFHAPTVWPVTIDHRFQGLSYYFSVTQTPEYLETIRAMETNINKSLTKYQNGITMEQVVNTRLTRIQIVNEKLYLLSSEQIVGRRQAHTISLLLDLLKIYKGRVPDVDFLLSTVDKPPNENLNIAPVFTFNKYKNENTLAIPFKIHGMQDVFALSVGSYDSTYKFENKMPKAVWRGNDNGQIRKDIYKWTRKHSEIDYEFTSTNYMSMSKQEHLYKYILDVDGFAWSSRFIQLLNMDMVIVKQESTMTDFCNEMIPESMYLTFSNESNLVNAIQFLIQKGDEYALNMINQRRTFAKRYCSKDAQMMYMFTLLNMYANLQRFKVVKDTKAVYVSNDVPSISYLELLLIAFVVASAALSALCCAQNFIKCKDYCTQIITDYEQIPTIDIELDELDRVILHTETATESLV